jgi:Flp pilus assembly protein TadG
MRRAQLGVTTVEFAIIGVALFTVVFAVIELGRALFVVNHHTALLTRPKSWTAPTSA